MWLVLLNVSRILSQSLWNTCLFVHVRCFYWLLTVLFCLKDILGSDEHGGKRWHFVLWHSCSVILYPQTPPSLLCLCFKHLDFGCTYTLLYYKLTIASGGGGVCWWRELYSPSPLSWWSGQQLGLCLSFVARASRWADISSALSAGATKGWGWGGGGDGRTRGGGGGGGGDAPQGRG